MASNIKKKITVSIDCKLLNSIKTYVYWTPEESLRSFVEEALSAHFKTKPGPHKQRKEPMSLKPGRPLGS